MTSEQLLILGLLAAAFAAGWFARGGRPERPEREREPEPEPAAQPARPVPDNGEAIVSEAVTALEWFEHLTRGCFDLRVVNGRRAGFCGLFGRGQARPSTEYQ